MEKSNFPSKEKVFLLPNEVINSQKVKLVNLRNPHSEKSCLFVLDFENKKVYEVLSFNELYRSWFIGNHIISDGSIQICSICNPLFLILPYFLEEKKSVPLDQLLIDEKYPHMVYLTEFVDDLSCIADRKGPAELNVWCYNEASTLNWLEQKVEKYSQVLQKRRERVSQGFSASINSVIDDKDAYRNLAFGIISEYLSEETSIVLRKHLRLPEIDKIEKENIDSTKKQKISPENQEKTSPKKSTAKPSQSTKEKALAKSAKGMKSITSFFTKK